MSWDNRRKRDTNIMFAVNYEDGRTAYITISPKVLEAGDHVARSVARERQELARHYLADASLPISRIAWLLGFQEVSAFTHAFKRWTGQTPTQMRSKITARISSAGDVGI